MNRSAYFVTPSYHRDFARCQILAESREICAPEIEHYIIVDPSDYSLFKSLSNNKTNVIDSRDIIDPRFSKVWGQNGWWISPSFRPVRGWIMQQVRKLAISRFVEKDIQINLDSDVLFIRPFNADMLMDGDKLSLFEVDYRNPEIEKWAEVGCDVTGIARPETVMNYVGMLISWWRQTVVDMTDVIENLNGTCWQDVVARQKLYSEYMMYGVFAKDLMTRNEVDHFIDRRVLVQNSWGHSTGSEKDLKNLFGTAPKEAVAVMVHSKDNVDPSEYRSIAQAEWAKI